MLRNHGQPGLVQVSAADSLGKATAPRPEWRASGSCAGCWLAVTQTPFGRKGLISPTALNSRPPGGPLGEREGLGQGRRPPRAAGSDDQ